MGVACWRLRSLQVGNPLVWFLTSDDQWVQYPYNAFYTGLPAGYYPASGANPRSIGVKNANGNMVWAATAPASGGPPSGGGGPMIVPTVPTYPNPPTTTGGSGSAPAPAEIPGAGSDCMPCGSVSVGAVAPIGATQAPPAASVAVATTATVVRPLSGYPWWVYLLAGFALAKLLEGRR